MLIKDVELANFADEDTTYAARTSIEELIKVLEKESKSAIDWFKMNDVIANSDKFQGMIMSCDKKENKHDLNINTYIILFVDSGTLLGIQIDIKSKFEKHVSTICKKASRQLNAISRIQSYIGKKRESNYY